MKLPESVENFIWPATGVFNNSKIRFRNARGLNTRPVEILPVRPVVTKLSYRIIARVQLHTGVKYRRKKINFLTRYIAIMQILLSLRYAKSRFFPFVDESLRRPCV